MNLFPLLLTPVVVLAATRAGHRLGPSAAGWVAALPITFAVVVVGVGLQSGAGPAAGVALSAAAHVPAQVVFAVVVVRVMTRHGLALGAAAGTVTYAVSSLAVDQMPAVVAVAVAVPALMLGPFGLPGPAVDGRGPDGSRNRSTTAYTCIAATLVVGVALAVSVLAGPQLAGTVAAFPAISLTLATAIVAHDGRTAGTHVLAGLIHGLPCYLTFCVVVALTTGRMGIAAVGLGLLGCLTAVGITGPVQRSQLWCRFTASRRRSTMWSTPRVWRSHRAWTRRRGCPGEWTRSAWISSLTTSRSCRAAEGVLGGSWAVRNMADLRESDGRSTEQLWQISDNSQVLPVQGRYPTE